MQPAPRARAVVGAPIEALLARSDELARRWAIALLLALPVERIGEFPLESFARQAPLLCAHVVRALQSDLELERIAPGVNGGRERSPTSRLAEVTGARDGKAAVEAVEALRGVLWEALLDELHARGFDQAPAREVADLADRLAYVCSTALVSSITWPSPVHLEPAAAETAPERAAREVVRADREPAVARSRRSPLGDGVVPADREPAVARSQRSPLGNGVVIIDEGHALGRRATAVAEHAPDAPPVTPSAAGSPPAGARRRRARPLPWDTPLRASPSDALDEPA
jgi:hypothetical protein